MFDIFCIDNLHITDSLLIWRFWLSYVCVFQNDLKEKDLAIRKFEQEIDSLSFRNNQLSMRVNVLQQELDETHARNKKHKVRSVLLPFITSANDRRYCFHQDLFVCFFGRLPKIL